MSTLIVVAIVQSVRNVYANDLWNVPFERAQFERQYDNIVADAHVGVILPRRAHPFPKAPPLIESVRDTVRFFDSRQVAITNVHPAH